MRGREEKREREEASEKESETERRAEVCRPRLRGNASQQVVQEGSVAPQRARGNCRGAGA